MAAEDGKEMITLPTDDKTKVNMENAAPPTDPILLLTDEEIMKAVLASNPSPREQIAVPYSITTPNNFVRRLVYQVLSRCMKHLVYEVSIDRVPTFHQGDQPLPEICCDLVTADRLNAMVNIIETQREAIEELKKLVFVPGLWKCPKCGLRLIRGASGPMGELMISPADLPGTQTGCANESCDGTMERVTEREASNDLEDRIVAMSEQIKGLVETLTLYKAGAKPQ